MIRCVRDFYLDFRLTIEMKKKVISYGDTHQLLQAIDRASSSALTSFFISVRQAKTPIERIEGKQIFKLSLFRKLDLFQCRGIRSI